MNEIREGERRTERKEPILGKAQHSSARVGKSDRPVKETNVLGEVKGRKPTHSSATYPKI